MRLSDLLALRAIRFVLPRPARLLERDRHQDRRVTFSRPQFFASRPPSRISTFTPDDHGDLSQRGRVLRSSNPPSSVQSSQFLTQHTPSPRVQERKVTRSFGPVRVPGLGRLGMKLIHPFFTFSLGRTTNSVRGQSCRSWINTFAKFNDSNPRAAE